MWLSELRRSEDSFRCMRHALQFPLDSVLEAGRNFMCFPDVMGSCLAVNRQRCHKYDGVDLHVLRGGYRYLSVENNNQTRFRLTAPGDATSTLPWDRSDAAPPNAHPLYTDPPRTSEFVRFRKIIKVSPIVIYWTGRASSRNRQGDPSRRVWRVDPGYYIHRKRSGIESAILARMRRSGEPAQFRQKK